MANSAAQQSIVGTPPVVALDGRVVDSPGTARWAWAMRLTVPLVMEVALMGALFVGYRQVRYLTKGGSETALANAADVVGFERGLGFYTERAVQRLALHSELVVEALNRYYVGVHFPVTVAFLLWAFLRHRSTYRAIRAMFVSVTAVALVIHVLYPLAPPRLIGDGFVDTLRVYGPNIYNADTSKSVANQFAAMPSLHFGWAALVAIGYMAIRRTPRSRWVLLHPLVTLLAIVATGNHYWLDAAVALVLVVTAALVVRRTRLWPSDGERRLDEAIASPSAPVLPRPPARHPANVRCQRRVAATAASVAVDQPSLPVPGPPPIAAGSGVGDDTAGP